MNKWADFKQRKAAQVEQPTAPDAFEAAPWVGHDKAILDHMQEIFGGSLFDGCGQPDCFDCTDERRSR